MVMPGTDCSRSSAYVVSDASCRSRPSIPAAIKRPRGSRHRDRADDVGTAGFLAIGQPGPVHVVGRDDLDGAAALVLRRALQEDVAPADQRAGAERRVHLVRRERHEVEMLGVVVRLDVDSPMRRQLRGIDQDARADAHALFAPDDGWAGRSR